MICRQRWARGLLALAVVLACTTPAFAQDPALQLGLAAMRLKAEAGDPTAQHFLGEAYFNGNVAIAQDFAEAGKWLGRAAKQGHAPAMTLYGRLLARGDGATRDLVAARGWFEKAAAKGDRDGVYYLAMAHAFGLGTRKNMPQAIALLKRAAAQGHGKAAFQLGDSYERGDGVKRDYAAAWRSYAQASDATFCRAYLRLGSMAERGLGRKPDKVLAARMYRRADGCSSDQGVMDEARKALARVEAGLTPAQRALASRQASDDYQAWIERMHQRKKR